jgi:transcriptional regulator with XRE-family HTH domain
MGSLVDADGDTGAASSALDQFAAKLRELRIKAGMPKQRALMMRAGIGKTHLSRTLNGRTLPSWELTSKLVVALQGDIGEFRILWRAARHELDEAARRGREEAAAESARQTELIEQARAAAEGRSGRSRGSSAGAGPGRSGRGAARGRRPQRRGPSRRGCPPGRVRPVGGRRDDRDRTERVRPRDQDKQDEHAPVPGRTGAVRRRRFLVTAFAAPVVTAGAVALLVVPFLSSALTAPRTGTDPALVASCYRVTAKDVRVFKSAAGEDIWASWLLGTRFAVSGASPKGTRFSTVLANGQHGWVTSNPRWVTPDSCQ